MPRKGFAIQRRGRNRLERTVAGKDGEAHVMQADRFYPQHPIAESDHRDASELAAGNWVAQFRRMVPLAALAAIPTPCPRPSPAGWSPCRLGSNTPAGRRATPRYR